MAVFMLVLLAMTQLVKLILCTDDAATKRSNPHIHILINAEGTELVRVEIVIGDWEVSSDYNS